MRKILTLMMCVLLLGACTPKTPVTDTTPAPSPLESAQPSAIRTMIAPTESNPIKDNWAVVGEVGVIMGDEYVDVILAADAEYDSDGSIIWDDAQKWALVATGEDKNYVLFDEFADGQMYMDVVTVDKQPEISLIHTSTAGLALTKYTYSDGAFYAEEVVTPSEKGNSIYNSFPQYTE
ncbi:MAG: hypothetical protein KIG65_09690 [Eubacteriales bacterium]|nr:hypothetical protein [Eubacteriales bacterium]